MNDYILKPKHQKEIEDIYIQYKHVIKAYIAQLEVYDSEFPGEILNELRAILGHIADCYETQSEYKIEENIQKANGHLKRATLDCYKYLCLSYDDYYKAFKHQYRFMDLSVIDNGDFISQLSIQYRDARQQLRNAKTSENKEEDVENAYGEFEIAYQKYSKIFETIEGSLDKIHRLKKKTFWMVVGSMLAWIVPIILSIVLYVLD